MASSVFFFEEKAEGKKAIEPRTAIARTKDSTKAFLAGRWNGSIGTVYRNACTQTEFSFDKCTETPCDVTVQADSFPDARDRLLEARSAPRDSSFKDPSNEKILESVVKIQRFYRARRDGLTAIQPTSDPPCTEDTDEQRTPPRFYRSRDFTILNRTSPRTRTDFELLHNLLDRWRIRETERASQQRFESSGIALGNLILSKEVALLRGIDSLKTAVKLRNSERKYRKFLDELSRPVVRRNGLGESILVDTPRVQRARRFGEAFDALSREDAPVQDRVRTLRRLRNDVEPHTCKPSDDLLRLLDQEIDLLTRDVDASKLNWLRNRAKIAFLIFARDALGNESDARDPLGRTTICPSCGRSLPVENFTRGKRSRASRCDRCLYAIPRTRPRIVYGPYERLLRDLRRTETERSSHGSLAFLVDADIVYRLLNEVWHGKSAISESDRLDELRLTRFRRNLEWSPWNCLPLTAREASVHRRVDDLELFYGPAMMRKLCANNLLAKLRFEPMVALGSRKEIPGRKKERKLDQIEQIT
ncbi:IQ motif and ubiquitin-like domain-containing protein [Ptiloglossa arizonensis]|uniref:IQ motif and ubiquitin-like domain-containing protein n=1 Tax=Ptiloglossa arizonensis TaxID=3350558 RepID=UPI003F9EDCA8